MRKICDFLLFFLILGFAAPASAAQTMIYDVYASGIRVLQARVDITTGATRYDIVMDSNTQGFLAMMVPWKGRFESHGWNLGKNNFIPELHQSTTWWQDEEEKKQYRYTKAGFKDLLVTEKGKTKTRESPPELTKGATDALTATLKVLAGAAAGKPCEGQSDVYDGRRRFTQVFHAQPDEALPVSDYNVFSGKASVCTVEVVPKGGAWSKKPRGWLSIQEQGLKHGALPTMWVAKLNKTGPAVPVKVRLKTSYGTLFLHLAEYRDGDKIATAKRRK